MFIKTLWVHYCILTKKKMDNLHWSGGYRIPSIKELCDILEHKFKEQEAENERLLKEN